MRPSHPDRGRQPGRRRIAGHAAAVGGHETHKAHDGVEAIEAAERLRPDAVLLDIGLPRTERLRSVPPHPAGAVGEGPGAGGADRLGAGGRPPAIARSRLRRPPGQARGPRRPDETARVAAVGAGCGVTSDAKLIVGVGCCAEWRSVGVRSCFLQVCPLSESAAARRQDVE